ncbi:MAG: alpha-E domain-containing protein [Fimbriimonadaceae bacterium]|nr:alpha-E domain-containing protein [Fimbriimonadaceae bacterium]
MLLSRVAHNLYWMGRFLERAENSGRQLKVASEFYIELSGLDNDRANEEWNFLTHCFPVPEGHNIKTTPKSDVCLRYLNYFLLDTENPVSVISSVAKARENARAVSETMTREVIYNLNHAYRGLQRPGGRKYRDEGHALEAVAACQRDLLTTLGAIEHTLTRDQGWCYHKFGEAMERTQRTLIVLGARLPSLEVPSEDTASPLHFAGWRSLLSNLASLENYRQMYGPRFERRNVLEFFVFHPGAPRTVNCGVRRMLGYLKQLPPHGPGVKSATREIGKLAATLEYDQEEILDRKDITQFINDSLDTLTRVHEAMTSPDQEL